MLRALLLIIMSAKLKKEEGLQTGDPQRTDYLIDFGEEVTSNRGFSLLSVRSGVAAIGRSGSDKTDSVTITASVAFDTGRYESIVMGQLDILSVAVVGAGSSPIVAHDECLGGIGLTSTALALT